MTSAVVAPAVAAAAGERETTHGGGSALAHTLSLRGRGWLRFFLPARQITCRNGVAAPARGGGRAPLPPDDLGLARHDLWTCYGFLVT